MVTEDPPLCFPSPSSIGGLIVLPVLICLFAGDECDFEIYLCCIHLFCCFCLFVVFVDLLICPPDLHYRPPSGRAALIMQQCLLVVQFSSPQRLGLQDCSRARQRFHDAQCSCTRAEFW